MKELVLIILLLVIILILINIIIYIVYKENKLVNSYNQRNSKDRKVS